MKNDDSAVPKTTEIYFTKFRWLDFTGSVFLIILGIFVSLNYDPTFGVICIVLGVLAGISVVAQALNREVQIRLDDRGIKTVETAFTSWSEISNERIISKVRTKGRNTYLVYDHKHGSEEIQIDHLAITGSQLEHLIRIYKGRYQKKQLKSIIWFY